jgi:hypothetical protein
MLPAVRRPAQSRLSKRPAEVRRSGPVRQNVGSSRRLDVQRIVLANEKLCGKGNEPHLRLEPQHRVIGPGDRRRAEKRREIANRLKILEGTEFQQREADLVSAVWIVLRNASVERRVDLVTSRATSPGPESLGKYFRPSKRMVRPPAIRSTRWYCISVSPVSTFNTRYRK